MDTPNQSEEMKPEFNIESDLRGNCLRVYWYMIIHNRPVGVREVQRALGMSSPSVAGHHLGRLVIMNLVEKNIDNSYSLKKFVKVGVLRNFVSYRGLLLPRYTFVTLFFTGFIIFYAIHILWAPISIFDRYVALVMGIVGLLFSLYETYRFWRIRLL